MSKYSNVNVKMIYDSCNNVLNEMKNNSLYKTYANISNNNNFLSPIKEKIDFSLNQILYSNAINGSLQNLKVHIENLKKIAGLIEDIQEIEKDISSLDNNYSYKVNLLTGEKEKVTNNLATYLISYKESQISDKEKRINELLNS